MNKYSIDFDSQGLKCSAWFYDPETSAPAPCIVMAHGFSAVREQRLDAYAERFSQAGLAVLLFDYRYFGDSQGEPRQLLSIGDQLKDWEAAIQAARNISGVDPDRIALFGSSFSGGHVQTIAARDHRIKAVIAQAPWCEGLISILPTAGIGALMKLSIAGIRDLVQSAFGAKPYLVPVVGKPGSLAIMTSSDSVSGFENITPPGSNWKNEVSARIALEVGFYRPGANAHKIKCPILYIIAETDQITPAKFAHEAANRAPLAEKKSFNCGHFDVYIPPVWNELVEYGTDFYVRHLKPGKN